MEEVPRELAAPSSSSPLLDAPPPPPATHSVSDVFELQDKLENRKVSVSSSPSFEGNEDERDDISYLPTRAAEQAEHLLRFVLEEAEQAEMLMRKVWEGAWNACPFHSLPKWLQDNEYIHRGYRPPLPSFGACFKSIFRLHTETANIWTHMIGCATFLIFLIYYLLHPHKEIQEKLVLGLFFLSAVVCLGLSFIFHTVNCHSERMGKLFSKLDYCGIATLIAGSFFPWLYYGFYCHTAQKVVYGALVGCLGITSVLVSLWDKFGETRFRWLRAVVFATFGCSGIIPAIHYLIVNGWFQAIYEGSFGWLFLMAALYLSGATIYALRVPERFFPGKFDIWFHSHQLFHVFVIVAAFVHFKGITEMAVYRNNGMATCVKL